jgi:putative exosortase-associated protein (TIGR04073 family)
MRTRKIAVLAAVSVLAAATSLAETSNFQPGNRTENKKAAETASAPSMAAQKAEKGVRNMLLGWTDIPKSIIQVTRDSENPFLGITAGTLRGLGKAFPRTISGIADAVTFPFNYEESSQLDSAGAAQK